LIALIHDENQKSFIDMSIMLVLFPSIQ